MQEKANVPAIRFAGFTDAWEHHEIKDSIFFNRYPQVSAEFLESLNTFDGDVTLLPSSKNYNWKCSSKDVDPKYVNDAEVITVGRARHSHTKYSKGKFIASNSHIIESNNQSKLRTKFLYYFILINEKKFYSDGSTYPKFTKLDFDDLDLVCPSETKEQVKITNLFSTLDSICTLHQRKYTRLCNVKKSMLEKMFPRDGASVPEIRFAGFTDAWEQRKLSELTSMHARIGWQNLRTSEFLDSGNYMLITGTDFNDGSINFQTCHYVERDRYEQDKNIQIHNNSILITKDGTLGKVAYVQGLSMPATLNAGVFNVQIKDKNNVDDKYLFQYLKAPFLLNYVDKKATGGTIKHLNQNILVDFPVILPQKPEQVLIGTIFQQLDHLITLHQRELERLQNIKKSCLEKMFV